MNRKRSKGKQNEDIKSQSSTGMPIPDRRAMEKTMSDIGKLLDEHEFSSTEEINAFLKNVMASGKVPKPSRQASALEQAQDIMYDAWDSSGKRRAELARSALEISKDCADAYVLLAEETANSWEEAKNLYEQGMKAGERALGPEVFEEEVGHFWGIIETRPYMQGRLGLAQCLWSLGERGQAIEHYTDMLRLNPNDNQGIRYILVNFLLEEGRDDALGDLFKLYEDDGAAAWLYSRALWVFRTEGPSIRANKYLKEALKQNRFVPSYLFGKKRLPKHKPEYMGFGDESEAVVYAEEGIKIWQKTEGALEWLAGILSKKSEGA